MAVDAPDPRTFKSWENAFQYPIPAVRGMEKKLRSSTSENQDKLRTLVGASYRDLLGTAKTIVRVNDEMHQVENGLLHIDKRSNSRLVAKLNTNFDKFETYSRLRDKERFEFGSQAVLLRNILHKVSELLQNDQSTLLIAKLLVIARVLIKTLSECKIEFPILEKLRIRLVSQRRRLLVQIDQRLAQLDRQVVDIVNDLSAFSLATSAMATDVMKHYQHIRLENMTREIDSYSPGRESSSFSTTWRLQHYLETVKLSREIFPKILGESLKALTAQPLVEDVSIHEILELELDVHEMWSATNIRNFTPWLWRDELDSTKASQLTDLWIKQAIDSFVGCLSREIKRFDLAKVAQTRKEIYEIWLSSRQRSQLSITTLEGVKKLSIPFEGRFLEIIHSFFGDLGHLPTIIMRNLEHLEPNVQPATSLWSDSSLKTDVSNGAVEFRDAILSGRSGVNEFLRKIIHLYDQCNANIMNARKILKEMRSVRWDDYLDEEENELSSDEILAVLIPSAASDGVESELRNVARTAISGIEKAIFEIVQTNKHQEEKLSRIGPKDEYLGHKTVNQTAAILLRIIRELRLRLPKLLQDDSSAAVPQLFGQESLGLIHEMLIQGATRGLPAFAFSMNTTTPLHPAYLDLWVGSPPTPVQPALRTFKYLRSLVCSMEQVGADTWSPNLVVMLKQRIRAIINRDIGTFIGEVHRGQSAHHIINDAKESGEAEIVVGKEGEKSKLMTVLNAKSQMIQLLFDVYYVQQALYLPQETEAETSGRDGHWDIVRPLEECLELEEAQLLRINRSAMQHWRRTYLLFGLLN